jgi:nucleotide sugar dehydrogenase
MKLGIIGGGFVGKATKLLKCNEIDIITYDIIKELCEPLGTTLKDICKCDMIFISVPTPMRKDGKCYLGIIENVIKEINCYINLNQKIVVLRSTVPVGTSDLNNCYFMPEFLTEKNFEPDFINNPKWIFGLKGTKQDNEFKKLIIDLINLSYKHGKIKSNDISFVDNKEAELIKLFRNNFLSVKVAFCNEIYQFCKSMNINYENVRKIATLDPRIGEGHTNVPGHDGKCGFGGTCFPKDCHNLLTQMKANNIKSTVIEGAINRNEKIDRVEKDWNKNKGRAVIFDVLKSELH